MSGNYLNPLMLRELRQNVRNNATVFLINLFIAVMVCCCVGYILFSDNAAGTGTNGNGKALFLSISGITSFACLIIVVISSSVQTFKQRKENDLMFVSAMTPLALVAGKWLAGAVMTLLLLSLSAPFIAVAYLLRGVDVQDILRAFLHTFISIQCLNAAGTALASIGKTQGITSVFVIIGIFAAVYGGMSIIFVPIMLMYSGTSGILSVWYLEMFYIIVLLSTTLFFLLIGCAALSPPTANRLLPVRIMTTVMFLLTFVFTYLVTYFVPAPYSLSSGTAPLAGWFLPWTVFTVLLFILTVHEREQWCFRIRRTIPKNILLRLLYFPFYTGSPCGIVWTVLLFAAAASIFLANASMFEDDFITAVCAVIFAFDYCVTAMLISSKFDPHRQMPVWGIVLFLLLFFSFGSFIAAFLFYASSLEFLSSDFYNAYRHSPLSTLNPFMLFDNTEYIFIPQAGAVFWLVFLLPFFMIWFIRRVQHFTPLGVNDAMTLEQAIEAVQQEKANVG